MKACSIDYTVIVQSADNVEDTQLMLQAAAKYPEVAGIVAYVPLEDPALTRELVSEYLKNSKVVGIRNLIHTYADPLWLRKESVNEGLDVLEEFGLTFDVVSVTQEHLGLVPFLGQRHPNLKMVIDHLSKPPIDQGIESEDGSIWRSQMTQAAENPNVYAKLSGLYPGSSMMDWSVDSIRPFILEALDIFGSERLMYGGDWPISILAGDYERVFAGLSEIFSELPERDQVNIFSETAKNFYGLRIG
jgi:L-fuconolactonase